MNRCKFKNLFGIPYQGLHKLRFGPFGFIDIFATLVLAGIIAYIFHIDSLYTFIALFFIGQLIHWLLCVKTPFINFFN